MTQTPTVEITRETLTVKILATVKDKLATMDEADLFLLEYRLCYTHLHTVTEVQTGKIPSRS